VSSIAPSGHTHSTLPRIPGTAAAVRLPASRSPMSVPTSLYSTRGAATNSPLLARHENAVGVHLAVDAAPGSIVSSPRAFTVSAKHTDTGTSQRSAISPPILRREPRADSDDPGCVVGPSSPPRRGLAAGAPVPGGRGSIRASGFPIRSPLPAGCPNTATPAPPSAIRTSPRRFRRWTSRHPPGRRRPDSWASPCLGGTVAGRGHDVEPPARGRCSRARRPRP
jgi:hypothetical protein